MGFSLRNFLEDLVNPNTVADMDRRQAQGQSLQYIRGEKPDPARLPSNQVKTALDQDQGRRDDLVRRIQQNSLQNPNDEKLKARNRAYINAISSGNNPTRILYENQELLNPSTPRSGIGQFTQPLGGAIVTGVGNTLAGASSLLGGTAEGILGETGFGNFYKQAGKEFSDITNQYTQAAGLGGNRPGENRLVTGLGQGAGSLATSLAAAYLTGGSTLPAVGFGINAGGEQYRNALASGLTNEQALGVGVLAGGVEGGLEKFGLDKYLGAGGTTLTRLGSRALTEGSQEFAQSLGQSAINDIYGNTDYRAALGNALVEGGLGAILGAGGDVAISGAQNLSNQLTVQPTRLTGNSVTATRDGVFNQQRQNIDANRGLIQRANTALRENANLLNKNEGGYIQIPGADGIIKSSQNAINRADAAIAENDRLTGNIPVSGGNGVQENVQVQNNSLSPQQQTIQDNRNVIGRVNKAIRENDRLSKIIDSFTSLNQDQGGFIRIPGGESQQKQSQEQSQEKPDAARLPGSEKVSSSKRKIRGFTDTVKQSDKTLAPLKELAKSTYTPKSNKITLQRAQQKITFEPNEARRQVLSQDWSAETAAMAGELIKYHQAKGDWDIASEILDVTAEKATRAGQGNQALSMYNRLSPEGVVQYAARQATKDGQSLSPELTQELTERAEAIKQMETDSVEQRMAINDMLELIARQKPQSKLNQLVSAWKAGLLTAITTTGGNIVGNTGQATGEQVTNALAVPIDMLTSIFFTGERTRAITLRGGFRGAFEGGAKGVQYFKTGFDERNDPMSKFDTRQIFFGDSKAGRAAEAYINGVFKLMGAQDQPFYYANYRISLAQQAKVAAINKGLKGQEAQDFRKDFEENPPDTALQMADQDARVATFQNETFLGKGAAKTARAFGPLGEFIIPFRGVPSAVATGVVNYSPLGYLKAAKTLIKGVYKGDFDQRQFSRQLTQANLGTFGLMSLGAKLYNDGYMTLDYPKDDDERKLWEVEGKQAFSIRLGDRWYSLNYVQPFATMMAAGGEMKRADNEGDNGISAFSRGMAMAGKAVTEQSFLRGVSGSIQALEDPSRYGERFLEQTAGSLVPNFIGKLASGTDATEREVDGILEAIQGDIPGLRQNLNPRRDLFGKEISNKQTPIPIEIVDPFRSQKASEGDSLIQELRRLQDLDFGVTPPRIRNKESFAGQQVDLSNDQVDRLEQLLGPAVETAWQATIRSPEYASMNDEERQRELRNVSEDVRAAMKVRFMESNGIGNTDEAVDKLSRNQFNLYEQGVSAYPGVNGLNREDGFSVGGPSAENQNSDTYQRYLEKYNLVDNTPTKGSGKFSQLTELDTERDRISNAKKLYKGEGTFADVPQWVKDRYYAQAGIKPKDLEYDIAAGFNSDDKAAFLTQALRSMKPSERFDQLIAYREKSLSGDYLANERTLDLLVKNGTITDEDRDTILRLTTASRSGSSGSRRTKKPPTLNFFGGGGGLSGTNSKLQQLLKEASA